MVSGFNLLGGQPSEDLKDVLSRIGQNLVYVTGSRSETMKRIRAGDYHLVFYSWMASMDRVDEFIAMVGVLLSQEAKESPKMAEYMAAIGRLFEIQQYDERQRAFEKIMLLIEEEHLIAPLFEMKTPILHAPSISIPMSRWRFTPSLADFTKAPLVAD